MRPQAEELPHWRRDICDENVVIENGEMLIPDRPGLGVDINEEEIAKHPWQHTALRHYKGTLTDIQPKDSRRYY